ncbi:MAG: molybdopterin-synthase adenylyltransferase MoeB [bacterium]|nr:molybdopterin-synthase adenylyltransferase MoeB [bacterium]
MDDYLRMLLEAKARVTEVSPDDLDTDHGVLIDVREPHEHALGLLPNAIPIPLSQLGARIGTVAADPATPIVAYCAVGDRSAIATAMLEDSGYSNVVSLAGGIKRWMAAGFPTKSDTALSEADRRRYARHIVMPSVGTSGQQRLLNASIVIVGAGGLGSPVALYLAAAGIGTIGLVDDDAVELSNLQRQILHTTKDEGRPKIDSAADRISAINPGVKVLARQVRLDGGNALDLLSGFDVIVDGTDNFATRYLINDASMHLDTPVVHGSVFRFEGQVAVFQPHESACYRCVFPAPPPADLAPNCTQAGVFGVLPGVIGSMQATEVLKLILGIGEPLVGKLLTYDGLDQSTHVVRLQRDRQCPACGQEPPELTTEG